MYFNEEQMFQIWNKKYKEEKELTKEEENIYWDQILKLIRGVMFTHRMTRFADYDELHGYCIDALMTAMPRYNPDKVLKSGKKPSLFNYLSLTCYWAMTYGTLTENKRKGRHVSYDVLSSNGFDKHIYDVEPKEDPKLSKNVLDNMIKKSRLTAECKTKCFLLNALTIEYMEICNIHPTKRGILKYYSEKEDISSHVKRQYFKVLQENKEVVLSLFT